MWESLLSPFISTRVFIDKNHDFWKWSFVPLSILKYEISHPCGWWRIYVHYLQFSSPKSCLQPNRKVVGSLHSRFSWWFLDLMWMPIHTTCIFCTKITSHVNSHSHNFQFLHWKLIPCKWRRKPMCTNLSFCEWKVRPMWMPNHITLHFGGWKVQPMWMVIHIHSLFSIHITLCFCTWKLGPKRLAYSYHILFLHVETLQHLHAYLLQPQVWWIKIGPHKHSYSHHANFFTMKSVTHAKWVEKISFGG